ncbi:MAG: DUF4832 domain-containing protein [Victivallaceae bacterium]|nr:DUF4832 domain-containing protein [Victivallaceae bacterium]
MMGWVYYHYENPRLYPVADPSEKLDFYEGLTTVYLRLPWAMIEPHEGEYHWEIIDSVAQRWIASGKKIALRIMASYTGVAGYGGIPKYVHDAGAKMIPYTLERNKVTSMEPVFDDPVFLQKLEKFLAAMAVRYANDPNVSFVDIGSFGTWGEGHTVFTHKLSSGESARQALIHAKLYRKYFPGKLLAISDDVVGPRTPGADFPLMKELRQMGITFRDDSILVNRNWYHEKLAQNYWPTMPVILEHQLLHVSINDKAWDPELLYRSIEAHHCSYMSINYWPDQHWKQCQSVMRKILRRIGYRIVPQRLEYPARIRPGVPFPIHLDVANGGVAPCYPGGYITYTLKDQSGNIRAVFTDANFNVRALPVGPADQIPQKRVSSRFTLHSLNNLTGGEYDLFLSVGSGMGTPELELPMESGDRQKRYRIGTIQVDSDYAGQYLGAAYWIWDKKTHKACSCYAVKTFRLNKKPARAELILSVDDNARVWLNGKELQSKCYRSWGDAEIQDVTPLVQSGENILAVEAINLASSCGIIAELRVAEDEQSEMHPLFVSDRSWKASAFASKGWQNLSGASSSWAPAMELRRNGEGVHAHSLKLYRQKKR